ncbi:hypothetical protein [Methylobacterium nodulans]|uniref:Uncharacterized protein n=1 Tax=Methylobacterium nodulans (strain LMG 21967 / CNCM I-2342 / ORS 2060) TaxID=460265 RepID=B8IXX9_METNO|nr:hypothetical protein [Methylobacterium nodulans]ACL63269.1 conserved hypothetical protein [Methylobacterium nodulans ORS 2060]
MPNRPEIESTKVDVVALFEELKQYREQESAASEQLTVPDYRKGKRNLAVWIDEAAFRQFKVMVAESGLTLQDYMVDLINREFERMGKPPIAK